MTAHTENDVLAKLSDASRVLSDPGQDIRGRKVIDREGAEIGHVSDLFVDKAENTVRVLEVRAGGFLGLGDRHFLVPVGAVASVPTGEVHIDQTREKVVNSPVYDPHLEIPSRDSWDGYLAYYDDAPF